MTGLDVTPCPACGMPTRVVMTEGNNRLRMELDKRVEDSTATILPVITAAGEKRVHVLTGAELPAPAAYRNHTTWCGRTAKRSRCRICQGPMAPGTGDDPDTGRPYTVHPCCAGPTRAEFREATGIRQAVLA